MQHFSTKRYIKIQFTTTSVVLLAQVREWKTVEFHSKAFKLIPANLVVVFGIVKGEYDKTISCSDGSKDKNGWSH